ncbi:MAG: tannase/feruloyl esterase family alpha/beta hydrolase [Clostridia bacterium]|nr:tannase/feruloyl esterase family alpha/beta hydrolase [Clostridia bacterium]
MKDTEFLKTLSLPDTTIDEVTREVSGTFMDMAGLPPFVRVLFTMRPSPVSCIHAEIWLPDDWNGYFLGTGNGGMAGGIAYGTLGAFLPFGYAVVNTDMGTSGDPARGIGQPDVWEDFLCRSTHGMTVLGKEIVRAWYGRAETLSYFFGASTGGNQAMILAQRFPEDYDGIIGGVPANNRTFIHTYFVWNFVHLHDKDHGPLFTEEQICGITDSAVQFFQSRGDGMPGDNFITCPSQSEEDIREFLSFLRKERPDFTEEQIEALQAVYNGPVNPVTGKRIYNGLPIGSEKFGGGIRDCQGEECPFFMPYRWVFGGYFSPYDFDFADDLETFSRHLSPLMNANDPDLRPFRDHGGKLLFFSGTADPCVPYPDAWRFMERIQAEMGGFAETAKFCQYYLLPGMDHGAGGDGANDFRGADGSSLLDVLRRWREEDTAPRTMLAVRYEDGKKVWERVVHPFGSQEFAGKNRPPVCDDDYLTR